MEKIYFQIFLIFILIFSIEDIFHHEISYYLLLLYLVIALILNFTYPYKKCFLSAIKKFIPGLTLIFLSYINRGNPGLGDGIIYLISALYLDISELFFIFLMSIFVAGIYSMLLILFFNIKGKNYKNHKIAFIPTALPAVLCIFLGKGIL